LRSLNGLLRSKSVLLVLARTSMVGGMPSSTNTPLTLGQVSIPESSSGTRPSPDVLNGLPPSAGLPTPIEMAMAPTLLVLRPGCKPNTVSTGTSDSENFYSRFGPATSASIFAVKVLSDEGEGTFSDIISGINAAVAHAVASRKPSVVNLSLGGSASKTIDDAVRGGIRRGIHFTIGQLPSRCQ